MCEDSPKDAPKGVKVHCAESRVYFSRKDSAIHIECPHMDAELGVEHLSPASRAQIRKEEAVLWAEAIGLIYSLTDLRDWRDRRLKELADLEKPAGGPGA